MAYRMYQRVIFCCCLLGVMLAAMPGQSAAHIDATTRNHSVSKETVVVAKNGVAKLPVIIAEKADKDVLADANELIACLGKITGAKFEIKPGGNGPGIYLGTMADFPTPSAAEGLKIFDVYDGKEAYAIRTETGSIKLLGATDLGVGYAETRFLELLGCRWFFQNPAWQVVPKSPTITFNLTETDRPEVLSRYFGYDMGQQFEKEDPDAGKVLTNWFKWNGVGSSVHAAPGHSAHVIRQRFQKEFDAHPEYNALVNGVRKHEGIWGQLCVTNPRVVEMAIQYANEFFDQHPDADMVSMGPDDGGDWCTCPECAKLGDPGNEAFYLANQVAKALQKNHPGKMVGLLAYNWHCDPPDFTLEPNVYVELTTALLLNTKYGFDQLLELWPQKCRRFGLYDYWAVYDWIRDELPSGRTGNMSYVAEKLPFYVKHGITVMSAESGNSWGSQGLGFYLASRLLWNSTADVNAMKEDFYQKAFGPAAPAMKAYYQRVDLAGKPLTGPTFYRLCLDDLEKAEGAARGRPDILARIEQLKEYHVYVYLLHRKKQPDLTPAEKKEAALQLMAWNYRLRNTYMTFWTFFAAFTTTQLSNEFKEPTWNWYEMREKREQVPYRDIHPITAEETEKRLNEIKAAYGDVPHIETVKFSNDLVLPKWDEKALEFAFGPYSAGVRASGYTVDQGYMFHGYMSPVALISQNGEALKVTFNQGITYDKMPEAEYVVSTAEGKEVTRGKLANGKHVLEIKVPAAGLYWLKYDDHGGGFLCIPAVDQPGAFALEKGEPYKASNYTGAFFYVPKGTRNIYLYANKGGDKFGLCRPDGKWVGADAKDAKPENRFCYLPADGRYMTIAVAPGNDGKVWSAFLLNRGTFHFFNIPNVLSFTASGVLVPREVAVKDGLIALEKGQTKTTDKMAK